MPGLDDFAIQHHRDVLNLNLVTERLKLEVPQLVSWDGVIPAADQLIHNPTFLVAFTQGIDSIRSQNLSLEEEEKYFAIGAAVETSRNLIGFMIDEEVVDNLPHMGRIALGNPGKSENNRYHKGLGTSSGVLISFLRHYKERFSRILTIDDFVNMATPIVVECMRLSIDQLKELQDGLFSMELEYDKEKQLLYPVKHSKLAILLSKIPNRPVSISRGSSSERLPKKYFVQDGYDGGIKNISFICPSLFTNDKLHVLQFRAVAAAYHLLNSSEHRNFINTVWKISPIYGLLSNLISAVDFGLTSQRGVAQDIVESGLLWATEESRSANIYRDIAGIISDFIVVAKDYLNEIDLASDPASLRESWGKTSSSDFVFWLVSKMDEDGPSKKRIRKILSLKSRYELDLEGWRDLFGSLIGE